MTDTPNTPPPLMKFLLKLVFVLIVGAGVICGIGYLLMCAMFNW
ncbi:MAG: hypothetical protein K0Q55_463 [Verrucomicrobia bacterium]|nr:hypothetical protein [Verrucomicrobiota bacterium]